MYWALLAVMSAAKRAWANETPPLALHRGRWRGRGRAAEMVEGSHAERVSRLLFLPSDTPASSISFQCTACLRASSVAGETGNVERIAKISGDSLSSSTYNVTNGLCEPERRGEPDQG